MARPSLKEQRTEQILDAFERCLPRFGLEGSSLERVAEEAGVKRTIIRHYVGNRDQLLSALLDRYLAQSQQSLDAFIAALPTKHRARTAVEWLFDPDYSDARMVQVANALFAAAADDDVLATEMRAWLADFVTRLEQVFTDDFPDADAASVAAVAAGVTGIYFNIEALYPLGNVGALAAASKSAALLLIETLETRQ
ncbi:MAG: TetR/AcrR family transcriptional regulator [Myxococcota bacterium]